MLRTLAGLFNTQQLLILGLGLLSAATLVLGGTRTGATFAAETTNQGNVFGMGTLVMANTKVGETTCYSSLNGTTDKNTNSCATLINTSARRPGEAVTQVIAVQNVGSVSAETFQVFSSGCAAGNADDEKFHGTGDPCASIGLTVQQCADAACTQPVSCRYGTAEGKSCSFDPNKTLATFAAAYKADAGLSLGTLAPDSTTYFKLGLMLDPNAGNAVQGRKAGFDLNWRFAQ